MSDAVPSTEDIDAEALQQVLDDPVQASILEVLVSEAGSQLNPSQVDKRADRNIDLETFYEHIDGLVESNLVIYTYIVGNGPVYELNRDALAAAVDNL